MTWNERAEEVVSILAKYPHMALVELIEHAIEGAVLDALNTAACGRCFEVEDVLMAAGVSYDEFLDKGPQLLGNKKGAANDV